MIRILKDRVICVRQPPRMGLRSGAGFQEMLRMASNGRCHAWCLWARKTVSVPNKVPWRGWTQIKDR